ncbi:O-antigen ligase family protein [Patescibacteria group bacterium]|nr:O-antigen ligase family protein [Patescibacteria group bacterium]MBU4000440.1 O-antigen ligase family protein [Patescibacteria group bacterium]MBU4057201.1 O-antigen ligase family protein [Patescibacteria group bacterium]MBU4368223.1 O-antigen ligase family protein [Patescibacteria group bacterium]
MRNDLPQHQKALSVGTGMNGVKPRSALPKTTGMGFWRGGWILYFLLAAAAGYFIAWQGLYFAYSLLSFVVLLLMAWKTKQALLALIFYLPLQFALNVSENIDLSLIRVLIVALFLIWLAKSLAQKKLFIPNKLQTWLILVFGALSLLSVFFSIDESRSAIRALFFLSILPLYFVAADYLKPAASLGKVAVVILFSAAVVALIGIIQFSAQFVFGINEVINFWSKNIAPIFYGHSFGALVLSYPSWLVNISGQTYLRAISLFPDPHIFAFYLGLVAPLSLSLFLFSGLLSFPLRTKAALGVLNVILLLALFLTFSRAGYIGAIFGIGFLVVLSWKFLRGNTKIALGAIFAIFLLVMFSAPNLLLERFYSVFNFREGSNSERLANWKNAFKIIESAPLTGVGVGAYALALDARSPERTPVSAHNTYLDIAAEMGIPAFLVWFALLFASAKKLISFSRAGAQSPLPFAFSLGMAGSLVWFSAQSFFDTAIYSPTLLAMLMVYFAITVNIVKGHYQND